MTNIVARTTRFGFGLIRFGVPRWQDQEWDNWRSLDTLLGAITALSGVEGVWENSTAYLIGDRRIDAETDEIYEALVAHTSAASPTTFEEDRDDNPTYWRVINGIPQNRGAWVTATAYHTNDFVQDGYRFGVVTEEYTSGATYDADVSAGSIETLIDLTDVADQIQDYAAALIGTSTTSLAIGTGEKIFVTQAGKQWALGQRLRAASDDGTLIMEGEVTAYSGTSLTLDVDYTQGAATHADWNISITGARGATGPQGPAGEGNGDVIGPGTHLDGTIPTFDGVDTNTLQDSGYSPADLLDRDNHTGTQDISSIDGLTDALDGKIAVSLLTTQGDIITRDGSAPKRLGIGTQHQVLLAGATEPGWGALNLAQAAAVTGILPNTNLPDATEGADGVVELATSAETETGTDQVRAVHPAGAAAVYIKRSLLTTRGDLIRRGASAPERVALGATGTFLQSDGTDAVWGAINFSTASLTGTIPAARLPLGQETIWVPAKACKARTTNGAAAGSLETTTNDVMIDYFAFDSTTSEAIQIMIQMPKSWNEGTIIAQFIWTHPSTTTNFGVRWGIRAVALADDEAADTAFGTEQEVSDTGGTTNDIYITAETGAMTVSSSPADENLVVFEFYRDPADANDTMAVDAYLIGVKLHYTVNAANDD